MEQEVEVTRPNQLPESGLTRVSQAGTQHTVSGNTQNLGWDASEMAQREPSQLVVGSQFLRITEQRRTPRGFYSSQLKKMGQG